MQEWWEKKKEWVTEGYFMLWGLDFIKFLKLSNEIKNLEDEYLRMSSKIKTLRIS